MQPRILSLFSGYGGLDMAVQEVFGGELVAVADIDSGPCKILAHRHPDVPNIHGPAPAPTMTSPRSGNQQLSPAFTEWMMGLPTGWITDVPGITRNEALKACGNGVVPQQAIAALRHMLAQQEVAA